MDTSTLVDRVYQALREHILQGIYKPGQRLNLAQLSRELEVSNTPIREAMARLERLGLVETVPYCGPKIKYVSIAQINDLYEVRIALDELAVKLAVQRGDPTVFHVLEDILQQHEYAVTKQDTRAMLAADRAFHDALVEASGNSVLLEMLPSLSDRTQMLLELNRPPDEVLDEIVLMRGLRDHKHLYELLVAGEMEEAIQELHSQLIRGKEQLIARMKARETAQKGV